MYAKLDATGMVMGRTVEEQIVDLLQETFDRYDITTENPHPEVVAHVKKIVEHQKKEAAEIKARGDDQTLTPMECKIVDLFGS
jgi:hypothetical protein